MKTLTVLPAAIPTNFIMLFFLGKNSSQSLFGLYPKSPVIFLDNNYIVFT